MVSKGSPLLDVRREEMRAAADCFVSTAIKDSGGPPFSFVDRGRASWEFLGSWRGEPASRTGDAERTELTSVWRDDRTGLEARCAAVKYHDLPAVEWLLTFTNTGKQDTPIISDIRALDMRVNVGANQCILHRSLGDSNSALSFAPVDEPLVPGAAERVFAPKGGRSSDGHMPYFNVDWKTGGIALAIGWSGQWEAGFSVNNSGNVRIRAGQQTTHLLLHPGETVRCPRIVLVFWEGEDHLRGNNLLRRLAIRHCYPRRDGKPVFPPICCSVATVAADGTYEGPHLDAVRPMAERGIEVFWSDMDPQQWYPVGFPEGTGNWEIDRAKYPNGLKPIGDAVRAAGMGYLLWFEPERVHPGTMVERKHPEWVMKAEGEWSNLFRMHDPAARAWLTDLIDKFVTEAQLAWVRWDFNIEPLTFWQRNDEPERAGITEIRHIEGLYAMWEELERRHPGLLIDNCSSGGRRLDIEAARYGLPLWHSDMHCVEQNVSTGDQLQNAGLNRWIPFHGCANFGLEPSYAFRSAMTAGNILISGLAQDEADATKRTVALYHELRPYMLGDFYPLFPHTDDEDAWFGYQFHRPETGDGFAMVFRRPKSAVASNRVRVRALKRDLWYCVQFDDCPKRRRLRGWQLEDLCVNIVECPGTSLIRYAPTKSE